MALIGESGAGKLESQKDPKLTGDYGSTEERGGVDPTDKPCKVT